MLLCPLRLGIAFHHWQAADEGDTLKAPLVSPAMTASALWYLTLNPGTAAWLARLLRRGSFGVRARNLAAVAKGVWLGHKLSELGVSHIHAHWLSTPATAAMIASRVSGIPYSVSAHRIDISQRNLIPEKMASARFIRAIDAKGQLEIQMNAPDLAEHVKLVYLGTHIPENVAPLVEHPLESIRIVTAARLVGKKGHKYLIDAIARTARQGISISADFFGDGPLKNELRSQAIEAGVADIVHFRGDLPHSDLLAKIQKGCYDIAILPSVTADDGDREGIPAFLMEAMAARVPVISTDNGGILELIRPGCGVIVPERDAKALASAIVNVASESKFRQGIARKGRDHASATFDVVASAAKLRTLMLGEPTEIEALTSNIPTEYQ